MAAREMLKLLIFQLAINKLPNSFQYKIVQINYQTQKQLRIQKVN